jgi:hypothetical protein
MINIKGIIASLFNFGRSAAGTKQHCEAAEAI